MRVKAFVLFGTGAFLVLVSFQFISHTRVYIILGTEEYKDV